MIETDGRAFGSMQWKMITLEATTGALTLEPLTDFFAEPRPLLVIPGRLRSGLQFQQLCDLHRSIVANFEPRESVACRDCYESVRVAIDITKRCIVEK